MAKTRPIAGSQHPARALQLRKAPRRWDTPLPWHKRCDHTESLSSCTLLSPGGYRLDSGRLAIMRVRLGCSGLHLRHRDHGEKPNEEQKQRSENSDRADVRPDIDPSRVINSPRRWQKIAHQTACDNDKALEPHTGVDAHADEENHQHVMPAPAEPKQLRRKHVAKEHPEPPVPPIGTENAVPKCVTLEMVAAIPGNKELHRVGITDE